MLISFKNKSIFYLLIFLSCTQTLFSQQLNSEFEAAMAAYNKAQNNYATFKNKQSVQLSEKVLIYALKTKNNLLAAKTYNLLGLNFEEFNEVNKAIAYFKTGVVFGTRANNDTVLGWLYNNLGGIYSYKDINQKESLNYFKKAYYHTKKSNDKPEFLISCLNLASNLQSFKQYSESKKYLDDIKTDVEIINDVDSKMSLYVSYAIYYEEFEKKYDLAEQNFLLAIKEGKRSNESSPKLNLLDAYKGFSEFYERQNKLPEALKYLKCHNDLQDEIEIENKKDVFTTDNPSANLSAINARIEKVEKENQTNLKKLQNNKYYFVFFGVLISLFIALLYFLSKNYNKNEKINRKLKTTNIELHKAKQKTEEITQLKSQFMSTVSHELRTPLYGVIGLTEIIETEHPELKESKYVKSLQFSAKYLLTLINDILNLSKIEDDKIELVLEDINILNELNIIADSLQVIAKQYHNKINIITHKNAPLYIKTDKTRLSQVLINLISNALKFTKNGTVEISYQLNESLDYLVFEVKDNGIGIPEKYIDKIFDKFTQVDRNTEEQFQGTGLGLAIVKKIINLFNGRINVESKINFGTRITFEIPYISGVALVEENNLTSKEINNCKILVVEDNKINQMVTRKLLQKNGLDCSIANDGYEALEMVKTHNYDIILMDIHMPGINGFETTEQIKAMNINTPIIALTAADKYELEADIIKYKMADILIKPFEFNDLKNILEKHVN